MALRAPTALAMALALVGCAEENEPHPALATIDPGEVTLPTLGPGNPPQFQSFEIENVGADILFITPATPRGPGAGLVEIDMPAYTKLLPSQSRLVEVTLDDRPWRWKTGAYDVEVDFEVSYFFSGQAIDEPEVPSSKEAPQRIADVYTLRVRYDIDCDADDDGYDAAFCGGDDCEDDEPAIHPGAEESCDRVDEDCDGAIDEFAIDLRSFWFDDDSDGFGDPTTEVEACESPGSDWVRNDEDCDDSTALTRPTAPEACFDEIDNNCNGLVDGEDPQCGG